MCFNFGKAMTSPQCQRILVFRNSELHAVFPSEGSGQDLQEPRGPGPPQEPGLGLAEGRRLEVGQGGGLPRRQDGPPRLLGRLLGRLHLRIIGLGGGDSRRTVHLQRGADHLGDDGAPRLDDTQGRYSGGSGCGGRRPGRTQTHRQRAGSGEAHLSASESIRKTTEINKCWALCNLNKHKMFYFTLRGFDRLSSSKG